MKKCRNQDFYVLLALYRKSQQSKRPVFLSALYTHLDIIMKGKWVDGREIIGNNKVKSSVYYTLTSMGRYGWIELRQSQTRNQFTVLFPRRDRLEHIREIAFKKGSGKQRTYMLLPLGEEIMKAHPLWKEYEHV